MSSNEVEGQRGAGLARMAIGLASLWILTGAAFKLFLGTPADLPPIVRDLPAQYGIDLGMTYRLTIGIELCIAFVALLRPRWGWAAVCLLLVVFEAVLLTLLGEESCGCFGSKVTLSPEMMATIDGALLVLILLARPWSRLGRGGPNVVWIAGALAIGVALPWMLDREVPRATVVADGVEPEVEGGWLELDLESWVGQDIWDTPLGDHIDLDKVSLDGLWVIYRSTCDHCAEHLEELAASEQGERPITLVRLKEEHDTEANRVVFVVPEGPMVQRVELTDSITYILTTPGELELEGGRVVSGREGVSSN